MAELKLAKLPDRTPVKLSLSISRDLSQALQDYGRLYAVSYGREEPVTELIPATLTSFLESDESFQRWLREPREGRSKRRMIPDDQPNSVDDRRVEPLTMRVPEAARLLSVSRSSLYRLMSDGEIEIAKSGHKTLIIVASLKAFIERHRVQVDSIDDNCV